MPMFFFLSGMCFNTEKYKNFMEFIKDKAPKRIIPYFMFATLGIIMCLIVPSWRISLFNIIIYNEEIRIMFNIPLHICVIGAIAIYIILVPITVLYNKISMYVKSGKQILM